MLTIAVLSWGAEKTLANTLESYVMNDLRAEQKIILLQEGTREQEYIAHAYGFKPIVLPFNVGIAQGYRRLLDEATQDLFLFLENDWELITHPSPQLPTGAYLLQSYDADLVRLRSRNKPGGPLWTRQFEGNEYARRSHLLDSIHWTDPSKFPEVSRRNIRGIKLVDGLAETADTWWYLTKAKYANWTNNPHMARTEFLRREVYPRLGSRDLEVDIQDWWVQQDFTVAQSDGLFTHNRLD